MTRWLSTSDVASLTGVSERAIRLRIEQGRYIGVRRRKNGIQIPFNSLPAEDQKRCFAAKQSAITEAVPPTLSFENASENQRVRAARRQAAVIDFEIHFSTWRPGRARARAKARWVEDYAAAHPEVSCLSIDTIEKWVSAYRAFGIDGLVDRNDGSARRGTSVVPLAARNFFREALRSGDSPTIARALEDTRLWASDAGIDLAGIADDAFYRYAATVPDLERRASGAEQDEPTWLPSTRRDYTTLPAMRVVQADHHIADVFVRCDAPECTKGHRPWLTVFIDARSRMVVAMVASLEYPSSQTILRAFRQLVSDHGLPEVVYIDNGKDFRKAFGKAIRVWGAPALNEGHFNNLLAALGMRAVFATPYRAQSKTIERLFGTFVSRIWRGSQAWVGQLGKRTERVARMFDDPGQLPSFAEFEAGLVDEITLYNTREGHRGHGMNGASPAQVFASTRIPRRDPDAAGFALVFWKHYVRMVRGGAVSIGTDRYRLIAEAGYDNEGRYVQVLVDPNDVRRALVLSGCEHCKPELRREKLSGCGCPGKGVLICEAEMWDRSTFSFDDPITAANQKEVARLEKIFRERARSGDVEAKRAIAAWPERRRELLAVIAAQRRTESEALLASVGGGRTIALLPQSKVARDAEVIRERLAGPYLTAAEREEANAIDLPAVESLRLLTEEASSRGTTDVDAAASANEEIAAISMDRRRREREAAGFCSATLHCPNAGNPFCEEHRRELLGD